MLVSKKYEKGQIISFKLVNGDEIVAKVLEDTGTSFTLDKPCTVMPSQQGLGLMQSLFTSDLNTSITLDKSHVMMHGPTINDIENHYITTTTGIEPVTAGSIIL